MRPNGRGGRFIVIGENIHATRVLLVKGTQVVAGDDGPPAVLFVDEGGRDRRMALPDEIVRSDPFRLGKVKHVRAALITGMEGGASAQDATDYIAALVRRQVAAGADFLDLNVDEIAPDPARQEAAMAWLVRTVEAVADGVPVALDSSSAAVIRSGLDASGRPAGAPLLNSASIERLDVLELAAEHGCPVVVTAAGEGAMPADAEARIANAERIVEAATARGIGLGRLHVDPLVLPVAVDPRHAVHYLEAVRSLRRRLGPAVHLTGGLSNVSFGLPARRVLNEVFIDLAVDAGADSGIIDPVANDLGAVFSVDREAAPYRLAADLLLGRDLYGADFVAAYRRGELTTA